MLKLTALVTRSSLRRNRWCGRLCGPAFSPSLAFSTEPPASSSSSSSSNLSKSVSDDVQVRKQLQSFLRAKRPVRNLDFEEDHEVRERSNYEVDYSYDKQLEIQNMGGIDEYKSRMSNSHNLGNPSRKERHSTMTFVDRILLEVSGGKGGNGCISFQGLSPSKKRADGGNGGHGGNVYLQADKSLYNLTFPTIHFNAGDGSHGSGDGMTGRNGRDVVIRVPVGTIVSEELPKINPNLEKEMKEFEAMTGLSLDEDGHNAHKVSPHDESESQDDEQEDDDDVNYVELNDEEVEKAAADLKHSVELNKHNEILLVAKGGSAGIGNKSVRGTALQRGRSMPSSKLPGQVGQHRRILLELKLIADVGLVGFPNAGKSSILFALSNAKPKIASYAFTTLHPSIGIVEYSDQERISMADIPGLIEGAHENRGLGHEFLRHIERTKVLLYVVDMPGTEGRNPIRDFKSLVKELFLYDESLLEKPGLVFANKADLEVHPQVLQGLRQEAAKFGYEVFTGSARHGQGIPQLAKQLRLLTAQADKELAAEKEAAEAATGKQAAPVTQEEEALPHGRKRGRGRSKTVQPPPEPKPPRKITLSDFELDQDIEEFANYTNERYRDNADEQDSKVREEVEEEEEAESTMTFEEKEAELSTEAIEAPAKSAPAPTSVRAPAAAPVASAPLSNDDVEEEFIDGPVRVPQPVVEEFDDDDDEDIDDDQYLDNIVYEVVEDPNMTDEEQFRIYEEIMADRRKEKRVIEQRRKKKAALATKAAQGDATEAVDGTEVSEKPKRTRGRKPKASADPEASTEAEEAAGSDEAPRPKRKSTTRRSTKKSASGEKGTIGDISFSELFR